LFRKKSTRPSFTENEKKTVEKSQKPEREKQQIKMQTVHINVKGGKQYEFQFSSPVMGLVVLKRLARELECDQSTLKLLQSGKVVKSDTVIKNIKKPLKAMLKKKKAAKGKAQAQDIAMQAENYTWSFNFSSIWKNVYDLGSSLLSVSIETPIPKSPLSFPSENSNVQCKATLLQTSQTLQSLAQLLANEADSISNNPEKHEETIERLSRAGLCLQELSSGLTTNKFPSAKTNTVKVESSQAAISLKKKTVEDELFDDLLEENPTPDLVIKQSTSQIAERKAPAANPLMDMMSSFLRKPSNSKSEIKLDPNAWKKDVPKKELKDWKQIMGRDANNMKNWNTKNFSDDYLSGSSTDAQKSGLSSMFGM